MPASPGSAGRTVLPLACTLTPADVPDRMRRWQLLHERAEPSVEVRPGRLEIRYVAAPDVLDELVELAAAERTCCGFVSWGVTEVDGRPTLQVTAPPDRPEAVLPVAAMFGVEQTPQAPPPR